MEEQNGFKMSNVWPEHFEHNLDFECRTVCVALLPMMTATTMMTMTTETVTTRKMRKQSRILLLIQAKQHGGTNHASVAFAALFLSSSF